MPEMPTPNEGEQVYLIRQAADAYLYFRTYVCAKTPEEAVKLAEQEDQDWVEDGDSGAFDEPRIYEAYAAEDESYDNLLAESDG
jgi:hypothetical protein